MKIMETIMAIDITVTRVKLAILMHLYTYPGQVEPLLGL